MKTLAPEVLLTTLTPTTERGLVQVVVHGVRDYRAKVRVSLYERAHRFPRTSRFARDSRFVQAVNGTIMVRFEGLPFGDYALAAFLCDGQDESVERNLADLLTGGYAFSNDVIPTWSAPSFDETRFTLDSAAKTVEISMRYYDTGEFAREEAELTPERAAEDSLDGRSHGFALAPMAY